MDFMEQCDDCLCKECLENCNENPDGCCYTCCKDSDECEPISQCPFGWYHDNQHLEVCMEFLSEHWVLIYGMSIRKTTKKSEKCSICGYRRPEMYLIHRHGGSYYMCRECVSYFLAIAALME